MATAKKAAPAKKPTAARKAAARKSASRKTAKPQPPAEPAALTRISPTAAWPFPTGPRP